MPACLPAGVDGIVKFWDLRQSGAPAGQAAAAMDLARLCDASVPHISQKQHGITSLALHPQGKGRQLVCPHMGAVWAAVLFPPFNISLIPVSPPALVCRQPAAGEPDGGTPLCVRPPAPPHRPHTLVWRAHRWGVRPAWALWASLEQHNSCHSRLLRGLKQYQEALPTCYLTLADMLFFLMLLSSQSHLSMSRRLGALMGHTSSADLRTAMSTSGR